jgi:hypothetical protein
VSYFYVFFPYIYGISFRRNDTGESSPGENGNGFARTVTSSPAEMLMIEGLPRTHRWTGDLMPRMC